MKTETTRAPGQGDFSRLRALVLTTSGMTIVVAFAACQALIGGTRLLFAFPAFGLLALAGVIGVFVVRSSRFSADRICLACTALFFAYMLVRAGLSPDHYLARFDIYSMVAGLIVYLLATAVVTDAKRRMAILAALLAVGVIHVVIGAVQFRNGDNWMPFAFLQRFNYGRRASGFYMCPNHLAGLLEIVGVFGLSISLWSRWPTWSKLLVGYATLICYIGVMLTGSRGGYLSTLFSLFVFAILSLWIARAARSALYLRIGAAGLVMIIIAAAGAFLVIGTSEDLTDRTKNVIDNKDIRIEFWRAALEQWKTSPLLGTGSRTYMYFGRQFRTPAVQLDPVYVHNDYLQLLAEYGLVGGVGFALFFIAHLRAGMISARRLGPRRIQVSQRILSNAMAINVGALAALPACVVHSFFDFNLHIPANLLLMAFVLGILANSGIQSETRPGLAAWPVACRCALASLALFLAVQVVRLLPGEWYAEQARTALRNQQPLVAMTSALNGLKLEQANPQLFYYLGRARHLSGDREPAGPARDSFYASALPAYESARRLAPMDETYLLELAFTLDSLSRYQEAEWLFGKARTLDPKSQALQRYYETHLENWKQNRTSGAPEPVAQEPPA
jgi:O-antigen ligase